MPTTPKTNKMKQISLSELNSYRGIAVVSGDGLVHEIINGLMSRESDWVEAINSIAIGKIPAGSGNALAYSTAYVKNEAYDNFKFKRISKTSRF